MVKFISGKNVLNTNSKKNHFINLKIISTSNEFTQEKTPMNVRNVVNLFTSSDLP